MRIGQGLPVSHMRKLFREKVLAVCAVFLLAVFADTSCISADAYSSEQNIVSCGDSCFLTDYSLSTAYVSRIYPYNEDYALDVQGEVFDIKINSGNIFVLYMRKGEVHTIGVDKFDFNGNYIETLIINMENLNEYCCIEIAPNGNIYTVSEDNELLCLDYNGIILSSQKLPLSVKQIHILPDGTVVAYADSSVLTVGGSVKTYGIPDGTSALLWLGDGYFIGFDKAVYKFYPSFEKISAGGMPASDVGAVSENYICVCSDDTIYALPKDGGKLKQIALGSYVNALCAVNGEIFALTDGGLAQFSESDLKEAVSYEEEPTEEFYVNSDYYFIDTENFYILHIQPETSVTAFKKSIDTNFDGFEILDKGLKNVTGGYIRTGYTAHFRSGGAQADFRLIVDGDLNCNGVCNGADFDLLCSILLGQTEPDEDCLKAADLNGDDKISLADLLLLSRKI